MTTTTQTSPALRWALRLSLLAGGVAAVLALQPRLLPQRSSGIFSQAAPPPAPSAPDNERVKTYCYQSVRTAAVLDGGGDAPAPDCFAVSADGRFARVFSSSSSSEAGEEGGGGVDVRPGHVLPGLWDGHGHLIPYGEFLHSADLFGAASPGEVRRRLRAFLEKNPGVGGKEEWVRGVGWDQMVMGGMPVAVGALLFFCLISSSPLFCDGLLGRGDQLTLW